MPEIRLLSSLLSASLQIIPCIIDYPRYNARTSPNRLKFLKRDSMSFDGLGLSPALVNAVLEKGYEAPTPIQSQAIPAIIEGRDVMAAAQTGTGKTAGFTLPLIERLSKDLKRVAIKYAH